jgi:hypothetical protein
VALLCRKDEDCGDLCGIRREECRRDRGFFTLLGIFSGRQLALDGEHRFRRVVFSAVLFLLLMFHLPIVRQRPRRRADELVALFQIMRRGPAVRRPGRVIFDDVRRLSCRRGIAVSSMG